MKDGKKKKREQEIIGASSMNYERATIDITQVYNRLYLLRAHAGTLLMTHTHTHTYRHIHTYTHRATRTSDFDAIVHDVIGLDVVEGDVVDCADDVEEQLAAVVHVLAPKNLKKHTKLI
jgi:hypothetical protein